MNDEKTMKVRVRHFHKLRVYLLPKDLKGIEKTFFPKIVAVEMLNDQSIQQYGRKS